MSTFNSKPFIHILSDQEKVNDILDHIPREFLQDWLQTNLLTKKEARVFTEQSDTAIKQSIRTKQLYPFFSKGSGRGKVNLFLKSDAILYGQNKKRIRKADGSN